MTIFGSTVDNLLSSNEQIGKVLEIPLRRAALLNRFVATPSESGTSGASGSVRRPIGIV
jgi:hypothetical protein